MKTDVQVENRFHLLADEMGQISLEELNLRGSLQGRKDRKYLVTSDEATDLLEWIAHLGVVKDPRILNHAGTHSHQHASTYFDTPDLRCYTMGLQKARRRFKTRTRTYIDSDLTFLEVKTKSRVGTVKNRIPWDQPGKLGQGGLDFVKQMAGLSEQMMRAGLTPSLDTAYCRTTVHAAGEVGARITFDRDLHWRSPGRGIETESAWWIIETKTSGPISAVDRKLWEWGHRPQPISKYMVGIAQFSPELPTQRWTRAISTITSPSH